MIPAWLGYVWFGLMLITSWVSYRAGHRAGRHPGTQPICGCGHHRSQHAIANGCAQWVMRRDYDVGWPSKQWVTCPCQGYVGPEPTPEFLWPHVDKEAKK